MRPTRRIDRRGDRGLRCRWIAGVGGDTMTAAVSQPVVPYRNLGCAVGGSIAAGGPVSQPGLRRAVQYRNRRSSISPLL